MDLLREQALQKSDASGAGCVSLKVAGALGGDDRGIGTIPESPPSDSESHIFCTQGKNSEVHVWNVDSVRTSADEGDDVGSRQRGTSGKGECVAHAAVEFQNCQNADSIRKMLSPFGELCRVR